MTANASDSGSKQSNSEASNSAQKLSTSPSHSEPSRPTKRLTLSELINKSNLTIVKLSMILIVLCLVLFGIAVYERIERPSPLYFEAFYNDETGVTNIKRMQALSYPNLTTESVLRWAAEAATASYTFDFYNYNQVLKEIRPFFTKDGYQNFVSALKSAGLLNRVIEKKLIVSSVVTGTPVVKREGKIVSGIYAWQVEFPMLLTFQSQSETTSRKVIVTLLIAQVPTIESVKGIGIASFVTGEATQ